MKKIYGNDYILSTMESMVRRDKAAHAVIICGERGTGKKLIADYYTTLLLCDAPQPDGKPCGCCTACKNTEQHVHPDVMYVPKSGKLEGYSVETAGDVATDAYVKPNNNSGRKIYIFSDCKNFDIRSQNRLLKLIEEPPDYAYFIFTAEARSAFLPTIISRCVCFGTVPCTEDDARMALSDDDFSENDINCAIACFHGNIGMCRSYLLDEELRKKVDLTKSLTDSIINKDEYALNAAFAASVKNRNDAGIAFVMLDKLVRDAAVKQKNASAGCLGCFGEGALRLSRMITVYQAARIHRHLEKAWKAVQSNVSIPLVIASLCAEIIDTV